MTTSIIALLDTDTALLDLMHDLLARQGYRTLRCPPPEIADVHALLRRARPALVLLDLWQAEREAGWEFLQRLWCDAATAHIPALVVTDATAILPVEADVLRMEGCPVVHTPLEAGELLAAIATLLGPSPVSQAGGVHLPTMPPTVPYVARRRGAGHGAPQPGGLPFA